VAQFLLARVIRRLKLTKVFPRFIRTTLAPAYSAVKKTSETTRASAIPVENIDAPLLLIAGGQDKLWYSDFMSRTILNRRKTSRHAKKDELLIYPNAGHQFRLPHLPTTVSWLAPKGAKLIINFGGTPQANAQAQADAWKKILGFLGKYLCD